MSAFDQLRYFDILDNLTAFYGDDEVKRICSQYGCEYEPTFFGFLDLYDGVARALHGRKKIIDFGCYLAFQAALFNRHERYVGVDVVDMDRFTPPNAEHHVMTIQEFISEHPEMQGKDWFAICSYVEDDEARKLIRETYDNCLVFYPINWNRGE